MDGIRQWRSEGARGTPMKQLQTMHQSLNTSEQSEAHSRPKQTAPGTGSSVMQLMSTMARKPHWQKGKLGMFAQSGSSPPACLLAQQAATLYGGIQGLTHASVGGSKPGCLLCRKNQEALA